jgi:hypothetical protein
MDARHYSPYALRRRGADSKRLVAFRDALIAFISIHRRCERVPQVRDRRLVADLGSNPANSYIPKYFTSKSFRIKDRFKNSFQVFESKGPPEEGSAKRLPLALRPASAFPSILNPQINVK